MGQKAASQQELGGTCGNQWLVPWGRWRCRRGAPQSSPGAGGLSLLQQTERWACSGLLFRLKDLLREAVNLPSLGLTAQN